MASVSKQKYPLSVSVFHGLVALAMISTLMVGYLLDDYEGLISLHRSLGITCLGLVVLRIFNRFLYWSALPPSVNPPGSILCAFEKTMHLLLYLCMLAVPLLGWLKTNAAGHAVSVFGFFDLPMLLSKNRALSPVLGGLHSLAAAPKSKPSSKTSNSAIQASLALTWRQCSI